MVGVTGVVGSIEAHGVTLGYERHPAVHHLHGCFRSGSLTAVVGPNGGGKSTLLKGIMGLLRPLEGRFVFNGVNRGDISYLPQIAEIDVDFPISVLDTVLLGHWRRVGAFGTLGPGLRIAAARALSTVGLDGFAARPVGSLSGGQRQRVLFARVLVADCPIILLDEPFTSIDTRTTADLLDLVLRWHGEGRTVVAVLHDLDQVRRHFPEALLLARKAVGWGAAADVLTEDNLRRARSMGEAWDQAAPVCDVVEP
ncbi:MAG: ABC transporter ATP-binding protein [Alphaproteobacteria bacterium]|nr:ABC transporter ATP-binding protein [Alphaproteobacteria bacterium]MBF0129640.1 ABC transporter ATP-binding protein [Alphaproteobacteria bacterium]